MPTDKHQSVLKFLLFAFCAFIEAWWHRPIRPVTAPNPGR